MCNDASCHASYMWVGHAEQLSEFYTAGLVGAKRTIPGLWRLQYVLSTVELFVVLFLLSWLLQWTDLLAFFFVRVASCRLCSALVSALDSAKYVCCKRPAALSTPSSIDVLTFQLALFPGPTQLSVACSMRLRFSDA